MLREEYGARIAHASIFVTPTTVKGMAFQRRREGERPQPEYLRVRP